MLKGCRYTTVDEIYVQNLLVLGISCSIRFNGLAIVLNGLNYEVSILDDIVCVQQKCYPSTREPQCIALSFKPMKVKHLVFPKIKERPRVRSINDVINDMEDARDSRHWYTQKNMKLSTGQTLDIWSAFSYTCCTEASFQDKAWRFHSKSGEFI